MSNQNLAGEDLWAFLCNPKSKVKAPALTKAEKLRRKKQRRNEEAQAALAKVTQALHECCAQMNMWQPITRIFVMYQVRCHCGEVHAQPELHVNDRPLVEMRHKQTKELKITRVDWSDAPATLPRRTIYLHATSTHCLSCIDDVLQQREFTAHQLDLFQEN